jgi:hypothetical protein
VLKAISRSIMARAGALNGAAWVVWGARGSAVMARYSVGKASLYLMTMLANMRFRANVLARIGGE